MVEMSDSDALLIVIFPTDLLLPFGLCLGYCL